jgi:hypothetical protein
MLQTRLNIRTQPALIGLETKLAQAPVRTELASFSLEQVAAILELETTAPQLTVDSTAGRAELAIAQPLELTRRLRDQGCREADFGTGRIAEEGDRLASFWEPVNAVEEMAAEEVPVPPLLLFRAPAQPVSIDFKPGTVQINYRPGSAAVKLGAKPEPQPYRPGSVRIYLRQQAAIEITWSRLDVLA